MQCRLCTSVDCVTHTHRAREQWTSRPFYVTELTSVFFFLRMFQIVYLATPNVPDISLMDLFCF